MSLYRIDFTCVMNRLRLVSKHLVSKRLCIETTGFCEHEGEVQANSVVNRYRRSAGNWKVIIFKGNQRQTECTCIKRQGRSVHIRTYACAYSWHLWNFFFFELHKTVFLIKFTGWKFHISHIILAFFIISLYPSINHSVLATNGQMHLSGKKNALCIPPGQPASPVSPAPQVFLKDSLLCHDVWLQDKTYLPSMAIRNIPLARSNSEALLLENPMNWGFTWGVWLLASGVFSCVLWYRVHTRGSKIDPRLLQSN